MMHFAASMVSCRYNAYSKVEVASTHFHVKEAYWQNEVDQFDL